MTRSRPTPATDRRARALATLLLVCLALLAACRAEGDTWPDIRESGVLRVGVDPTFPPFALAEGEAVTGLDIDLARAVARELSLEPRFTYFGYDGLYDALTTGQVDVLISALVIAPERTQDVAYTKPYFDAGQVLIAGDTLPGAARMADLAGRALAVELGALGHVAALDWQRRLDGLTVIPYDSVEAALDAVAGGAADAALVDAVGGRLYLRDHPDVPLRRLTEPVSPEPYAMVVRIGDRTLLEELDAALERLETGGELEAIISRWVGP